MVKTKSKSEIELSVVCSPWAGVRSAIHTVLVNVGEFPRVRVWDPIGKHYTLCHNLTRRSERRIIEIAKGKIS